MPSLLDHFSAHPYQFDFFAAVRLLAAASPHLRLPGTDAPPEGELARFRGHLSLAFPPSQIVEALPPDADDERPGPLLTVTFLGLYGPSRVLPTHYTQLLLDTHRDVRGPERRSLRDWLDLFNHRFTSLFYRAWEKYRFARSYERGDARRPGGDAFTLAVRSLMGFGSAGLSNRLLVRRGGAELDRGYAWADSDRDDPHAGRADPAVLARTDDLGLVYYAGFFAQRPRTLVNLRLMIADHFALPVAVEPFRGQWLPVADGQQMRFGMMGTLGVDAVVGERVWDVQAKFRVVLSPLSLPQFEELLPDPAPAKPRKTLFLLSQLVRTYVGTEYDFDVQLVLKAAAVPKAELADGPGLGPRLGWNMWTISDTPPADAADAVFEGEWVTVL